MVHDMDAEALRARVRLICLAFPGTAEVVNNPVHSGFTVNGKTFCYFLNDHHGDGIVGVTCKAMPGVQAALIDMDRERFYLPAYMHRHGWIGMRLDLDPVDWAHLEQLLTEAYLASAPRKMAREWEASRMAT